MFPSLFSEPSVCLSFGMNIFHVETHTPAISVYDVFPFQRSWGFCFNYYYYYYYLKIMEYFTNLQHPCAGFMLIFFVSFHF